MPAHRRWRQQEKNLLTLLGKKLSQQHQIAKCEKGQQQRGSFALLFAVPALSVVLCKICSTSPFLVQLFCSLFKCLLYHLHHNRKLHSQEFEPNGQLEDILGTASSVTLGRPQENLFDTLRLWFQILHCWIKYYGLLSLNYGSHIT